MLTRILRIKYKKVIKIKKTQVSHMLIFKALIANDNH